MPQFGLRGLLLLLAFCERFVRIPAGFFFSLL